MNLKREGLEDFVRRFPCWSSDVIEYAAMKTRKPLRELYAELAHELHSGAGVSRSANYFLHKYGISDPFEIVKGRPSERGTDELIENAVERLKDDEELVGMVRSRYKECLRNLISD